MGSYFDSRLTGLTAVFSLSDDGVGDGRDVGATATGGGDSAEESPAPVVRLITSSKATVSALDSPLPWPEVRAKTISGFLRSTARSSRSGSGVAAAEAADDGGAAGGESRAPSVSGGGSVGISGVKESSKSISRSHGSLALGGRTAVAP